MADPVHEVHINAEFPSTRLIIVMPPIFPLLSITNIEITKAHVEVGPFSAAQTKTTIPSLLWNGCLTS